MNTLERFGRVFEIICLVGCGFFVGATVTAVRVRASVSRVFQADLDACKSNLDAHDTFIRLVVADVEDAVGRAAEVLRASQAFARPGAPTYPPTAFAGGQWWGFDVGSGRWEPVEGLEP